MKRAPFSAEAEYEALPGCCRFTYVVDGMVFDWQPETRGILGEPSETVAAFQVLSAGMPWRLACLGYSKRLALHWFRRGKKKLAGFERLRSLWD